VVRLLKRLRAGGTSILCEVNLKVSHLLITFGVGALTITALSQSSMRSVWDGVYTPEQAQRGHVLYSANCSSCHGDDLGGIEGAPQLAGGEFMSVWNGLTANDLFGRIRTTMPADHPGKLSDAEVLDVLAYILAQNNLPAGNLELPHGSDGLKQIRMSTEKPKSIRMLAPVLTGSHRLPYAESERPDHPDRAWHQLMCARE